MAGAETLGAAIENVAQASSMAASGIHRRRRTWQNDELAQESSRHVPGAMVAVMGLSVVDATIGDKRGDGQNSEGAVRARRRASPARLDDFAPIHVELLACRRVANLEAQPRPPAGMPRCSAELRNPDESCALAGHLSWNGKEAAGTINRTSQSAGQVLRAS